MTEDLIEKYFIYKILDGHSNHKLLVHFFFFIKQVNFLSSILYIKARVLTEKYLSFTFDVFATISDRRNCRNIKKRVVFLDSRWNLQDARRFCEKPHTLCKQLLTGNSS